MGPTEYKKPENMGGKKLLSILTHTNKFNDGNVFHSTNFQIYFC